MPLTPTEDPQARAVLWLRAAANEIEAGRLRAESFDVQRRMMSYTDSLGVVQYVPAMIVEARIVVRGPA